MQICSFKSAQLQMSSVKIKLGNKNFFFFTEALEEDVALKLLFFSSSGFR